jgi:hypothetical protein
MKLNLNEKKEVEWIFSWKELFLLFLKRGKFIITEASLDKFTVSLIQARNIIEEMKKDQK